MARLYIDENLAGQLVSDLRDLRHEVAFAGDIGQGRTDAWHFREALNQKRVLITLDKGDFRYLHRLWTALRTLAVIEQVHAGILAAVQTREFAHPNWLAALNEKLTVPEDLAGRMSIWHPTSGWHEDDSRPED